MDVSKVNGQQIDRKLIIPLVTFAFTDIKLPSRGTHVQLRGYEEGGYHGIPDEAFKDIPEVATDGFYFESYFRVTAIVSPHGESSRVTGDGCLVIP